MFPVKHAVLLAAVVTLPLLACDPPVPTGPSVTVAMPDPPPTCELSEADMIGALSAQALHKMTDAEFAAWKIYAGRHGDMPDVTAAWVVPDEGDYAVAMVEQGCIVMVVHGFSASDLRDLYRDPNEPDGVKI